MSNDALDTKIKEFDKVLVVDDDELTVNLIVSQLKSLGFKNITTKSDGRSAWEALNTGTYSLIIQDWKLPELSGLSLFNRLRMRKESQLTPVLVVSGLLTRHDFRLLEEFPCTALAEKPFSLKIIRDRISEIIDESIWYQQNTALVNEVFDAVNHDHNKIEQVVKKILKKSTRPVPLALIAVRALIKNGSYQSAENLLETLHHEAPESVMITNELGKVMLLRGKHNAAALVLKDAERLSANNVSRLCLIGEAELHSKDFEEAKNYFAKVLAIDPEEQKAIAGMVLAKNMLEHSLYQGPDQLTHSFASLLNIVGINYVRDGKYQKGIEQYKSAMSFIQHPVESAKLAFNLGLGYLRWGQKREALSWFKRSEASSMGAFSRSGSYVKVLESSNEGGGLSPFTIGQADNINEVSLASSDTPKAIAHEAPSTEVKSPEVMSIDNLALALGQPLKKLTPTTIS